MCGSVGTADDLSQVGQVVLVWCRSLLTLLQLKILLWKTDSHCPQMTLQTNSLLSRNKFDQLTMLPAQRDGSPRNQTNPPYLSSYLSRVYPPAVSCRVLKISVSCRNYFLCSKEHHRSMLMEERDVNINAEL